jgi:hypothetical protein
MFSLVQGRAEDEMTNLQKLACGIAVGCALGAWSVAPAAAACVTSLTVHLQTTGQGVTVELHHGVPGSSIIVASQDSSGGRVHFPDLCPGSYFMAIGNGDDVEVTPVHQFDDDMNYESTISYQRGAGNITHKSRKDL